MLKLVISLAVVIGVCFAAPYASYGPRDGSARTPVGVGVVPEAGYGGGYNRPYQNVLPGEPIGFPTGSGGYQPPGYPINAMQGRPYPGGYQERYNGYQGHGGGYDRRGEYGQQGSGYYGHQEFPRGHHHGYDHGRDHGHGHIFGHGHEYGRGY